MEPPMRIKRRPARGSRVLSSEGRSAPSRTWNRAQQGGMFVRYYVELPVHVDRVERRLTASPASWLPGIADQSQARGRRLLTEVGLGDRLRLVERVLLEVGRPTRFPSKLVLPLHWRAEGGEALFPVLDADLEVARLTPAITQLSISARYTPPLGALGSTIDHAVLHRVAEATVKDFVDRVATVLLEGARPLRQASG